MFLEEGPFPDAIKSEEPWPQASHSIIRRMIICSNGLFHGTSAVRSSFVQPPGTHHIVFLPTTYIESLMLHLEESHANMLFLMDRSQKISFSPFYVVSRSIEPLENIAITGFGIAFNSF